MTYTLWRVTPSDVERLEGATADQVREFLFGEPAGPPDDRKRGGLIGWLKNLSPIRIETPGTSPGPLEGRETRAAGELDLEGVWHGLHYLFTGTAWEGEEPACFLLGGGDDLGRDEIGDSMPRVLRPGRVEQFASFLGQLTAAELTRRYDPVHMMKLEIHPEAWDRDGEPGLEGLLDAFEELRDFLRTAATRGEAVVVLVS